MICHKTCDENLKLMKHSYFSSDIPKQTTFNFNQIFH